MIRMHIPAGFLLSLLFILTGCTISTSVPQTPMVTETPAATQLVVRLATATPLPASPSPSPDVPPTPFEELVSNVIGTILPLPDQDIANVRNGPGAVYDLIGTLKAQQSVYVIGKNADSTWWKVASDELVGWVYTDYVFIPGDTSAVPCFSETSTCPSPLSQENDEKAVSAIRAFTEQPDLQLSFQQVTSDPNADMLQVMIFADAQGSHYYVDSLKYLVIEYLPQQKTETLNTSNMEIDALRSLAVQFASRTSSTFQQKMALLHYSEEIGEQTVAFRWEDKNFQGQSNSKPYLQIVLNQNGEIIHYINTFDVIQE